MLSITDYLTACTGILAIILVVLEIFRCWYSLFDDSVFHLFFSALRILWSSLPHRAACVAARVHFVFTAVLRTSPWLLRFLVFTRIVSQLFFRHEGKWVTSIMHLPSFGVPLASKFDDNCGHLFILWVKYTYHRRFNQRLQLSSSHNGHSRYRQRTIIQYIILGGLFFRIWKIHKQKYGTQ